MPRVVVGQCALTDGSYHKCSRDLQRGEVKRVMPRGPVFVGYYISCAGCAFVGVYLHDDCGFAETERKTTRDLPMIIRIERPPECRKCKAKIMVEDGQLLAVREG